jgi:predicted metalloprotease
VKRWCTWLVALGLVPPLVAACAQPAEDDSVFGTIGQEKIAPPTSSDDPDDLAEQALDDITIYWRGEFPQAYGGDFVDVSGFYPYDSSELPPPCGDERPTYEDIENNAFYCPDSDYIAWDSEQLIPYINDTFGSFTVAIVMAHEFGHAVQDRAEAFDRSIDLELQADCFAGAWTAWVRDGHSTAFDEDDIDLDRAVAGIVEVRDPAGTDPSEVGAHGSGFDRVGAFQDGFENGASACTPYADENVDRTVAEIPFTEGDYETGGNLHLDDLGPDDPGLLTLVEADLNEFYAWLFGQIGEQWTPVNDLVVVDPDNDQVTCGGDALSGSELDYAELYCEDENIVVVDGPGLITDLNEGIGDFAVSSELAQLWALAAQVQLGTVDEDKADLQADCLTGLWAASTFPGVEDVTETPLQISGGDLDEGIIAFLNSGSAPGENARTVFERTEALRAGVFEGEDGCRSYGPL